MITAGGRSSSSSSLVLARDGDFLGEHTRMFRLPCRDLLDTVLCEVVALQLLTAHGAHSMGRDPNRWLGGRRTDQVQSMSQQTIRGSRIVTRP